jgi:hypothetical protein
VSVDHIYWAYSAAAQSISAFVALLLTEYTLVHMFMESARDRDDSLEEIHKALRKTYHERLTRLAWLTGTAIILSLLVAYLNRPNAPVANWIQFLVAAIDLFSIIGGLRFVVSIVDPEKYQLAARKELKQTLQSTSVNSPSNKFFEAFLHLERIIRDYIMNRELFVPSKGSAKMFFSFRQMIEALLVNEKINRSFYEELLEINKYRNLVFHGHVTQVDEIMVERTRKAVNKIAELP